MDDLFPSRMPALMAAYAVAMSARTGQLMPHAVDDMRVKAEELLDRGDDLRAACILFATKYEELKRDAYALRVLGEALAADIERAIGARRDLAR